jgi:hypothetical protein
VKLTGRGKALLWTAAVLVLLILNARYVGHVPSDCP